VEQLVCNQPNRQKSNGRKKKKKNEELAPKADNCLGNADQTELPGFAGGGFWQHVQIKRTAYGAITKIKKNNPYQEKKENQNLYGGKAALAVAKGGDKQRKLSVEKSEK